MATASPTPMGSYGRARVQTSTRVRRDSPMSVLGESQGFSANAPMMQSIDIGDSSDDEIPQPMKLSALTTALLAQNDDAMSPERRKPKLKISRNGSASNTPERARQDSLTPAPSLRIKRVPLRGAPMRRFRRTPQSEEDHPPSQDQENLPASVVRVKEEHPNVPDSVLKMTDSVMKVRDERDARPAQQHQSPLQRHQSPLQRHQSPLQRRQSPLQRRQSPPPQQQEKPVPLQSRDANTPRRPAPPPPPKMSVLEAATVAAGAATATKHRERKKRSTLSVNGKHYSQMDRIGRGGSSAVYRVMAENFKLLALKRVKLEDADEAAVRGYKGEIDLLQKLKDVERVVRLYDWEVDEQRQILSVLMEIGESDLARIIRMKLDPTDSSAPGTLDLSFTRFYWKEMLECVGAVHAHDIVHSDLKPANFLLVSGRLKLIDFGIANAIDTDNTVNVHRDSHIGTPNYMSPESLEDSAGGAQGQLSNGQAAKDMALGKPSDVWSLGCILYQMVYGRPPFAHIANQMARVLAIVNRAHAIAFPDLGLGDVRVPPALKATLRRCLDRDPARRPTVMQLLDQRDGFLYPDAGEDLRIPQDLLAQIITRVADRFRDEAKPAPTEEEIRMYPKSFYEKIRALLESGG
ncbi:kinase-like protein [Didymella exigua CBS 183.55]|uniref:Kinase-like protein n=1 Tax=Didymella exigua CBS 183.55 TaxID=1150837 RepID=A0A6A5RX92_9PLEO|nr:kinase-like protein [Didymella exigua CBS 183.55]KAF1932462.1 kinase-like protein [Didymella exigua CBS 183.55]